MKAKSMHKKKKQTLGIDHSARRKMRAEQISNGTSITPPKPVPGYRRGLQRNL